MAPSHNAFGAMVYLADVESRRVLRGPVGCIQPTSGLQTPKDAASEHSLGTAFLHGSNPYRSGTTHPKSFPSENTKRGHYV